jgi:hypothetical protein
MLPPSVACITLIKVGSSSLKPILNVGVLLNKFANSAQVDCTNPCIASLIFFALDLVIGPSGTCNGSLRFGLPWGPSLPVADLRRVTSVSKLGFQWVIFGDFSIRFLRIS